MHNNLILTFDIEEWYHANYPGYDYMSNTSDRVRLPELLPRIVDLLLEHESRATFFVLGEIARKFPALMRSISDAGFPVACHSMTHRLHREMELDEILSEARTGKDSIEDVTGRDVRGFRAPCFAIDERVLNFYAEFLPELGYEYDSSLVPVRFTNGGFTNMPDIPFSVGRLIEFPIGVYSGLGMGIPSSGACFRMLPEVVLNRKLKRAKKPFVIYLHPKDLDAENPPLATGQLYNWLHRAGTGGSMKRFLNMLRNNHFVSIEDHILFMTNRQTEKKTGIL